MSGREFSFGRLAVTSLGSATLVLVLTTAVVALWRPGPGWGLVVVAVGIVSAIAVMGAVSTWTTRKAFDDDAGDHRVDDRPGGTP